MEKEYLTSITAIFSVIVSGLFAIFAYYQRVRTEHLKAKKKTLYYLLEIRHIVRMSIIQKGNFESNIAKFLEDYFNKFGCKLSNEDQVYLEENIGSQICEIFNKMTPDISEELVERYETTLDSIAEYDPLTAFRLKGKNLISDVVEYLNEFLGGIVSDIQFKDNTPIKMQNRVRGAVTKNYGKIKNEYLKLLDEEILVLTFRISFFSYLKCRFLLKRSHKVTSELELTKFQENELKQWLDGMFKDIAQLVREEDKNEIIPDSV